MLFLLGLMALRVWDPYPVETLRLRTFDFYQQLEPRDAGASPVVIVDIDEESLATLGQWPWPRTLLASLLKRLFDSGALVVGFDIIFAEGDRMSPGTFARSIDGLPPSVVAELRDLPSNDGVFADMLRRTRVTLGLGATTVDGTASSDRNRPRAAVAEIGGDPRRHLIAYGGVVRNIPKLEAAAKGWGMLALGPERDGIVRRIPALFRAGNDIYPSFIVELLRVVAGQKAYAVRSNEAGIDSVVVATKRIPTDERGRIWIHFADPDPRRYVAASRVLGGDLPQRAFAGRIVLVGSSASGLVDVQRIPLGITVPGVEIHAQLMEAILTGAHLSRPNYAIGAELVLVLLTGLAMIALVPMVGPWWTLAVGAAFGAVLAAGSWHLFVNDRVLLDATFPVITTLALHSFFTILSYVKEEVGRRQIKAAFSRYLAPEIVDRLAENPRRLVLGGENREMTLLFSDVQGFTSISEDYDAEGLTNLVNRLLTPLTAAVFECGGTVDKYLGDGMMAFWNAPLDDPDHARNACLAALRIRSEIEPLNASLKATFEGSGRPYRRINVGVGINTGVCCVGNMGTDLRFDYSVLGDVVNTAARLEGLTRIYKVGSVVGETAYEKVTGLAFLELDWVRVVGKSNPVRIFTLLGDDEFAATPAFGTLQQAHQRMLAAYRARHWDEASRCIAECRDAEAARGLDGFYDVMSERISAYRKNPPPADWDMVAEMTTKG